MPARDMRDLPSTSKRRMVLPASTPSDGYCRTACTPGKHPATRRARHAGLARHGRRPVIYKQASCERTERFRQHYHADPIEGSHGHMNIHYLNICRDGYIDRIDRCCRYVLTRTPRQDTRATGRNPSVETRRTMQRACSPPPCLTPTSSHQGHPLVTGHALDMTGFAGGMAILRADRISASSGLKGASARHPRQRLSQ